MSPSDDECDYGWEYSEDSASEPDVTLENQYYHAKSLKDKDTTAALKDFHNVLEQQGDIKSIWGFKALKQLIKINYMQKNYGESMELYPELLTYLNSAVTKNHAEKSINNILDYVSNSENAEVLKYFYERTLDVLKNTKNDRLWFKTNTKLGKLLLERGEFAKLTVIIRQLKGTCRAASCDADESESQDDGSGTHLLEIYALEIEMYTAQRNHKQLRTMYERCMKVRSALPHPMIMSIVRECGGKMYLRDGKYAKAYSDFFEAFKNYDEAGSPRRMACLKYLLLTSMLMDSAINPFYSQEVKPYKDKPEVRFMTDLIAAYQSSDMFEFERIFQRNRNSFMEDPFIREHVVNLLQNFRTKVLLLLIKPYSAIKVSYIGDELGISKDEAEDLVVSCILDNTIKGKIDQVNGVLVICKENCKAIYTAIGNVATCLSKILKAL